MKTEDIVKGVLEQYIGSQINIDSETARDLLAKHIASEIDYPDQASSSDYVDKDLSV